MINRRFVCLAMSLALALFPALSGAAKLSKKDRAAVGSGTATHEQNANYVGNMMTDEVQRYAMLQAWAVNPGDHPIESYTAQISEDKVPKMFRGTDAGKMMIENGAISKCLWEEPCASHLAVIAVQMQQIPKETLVAAYRQKSQIDAELLREQIGSNLSTAIATAQVTTPQPTQSPTARIQVGSSVGNEGQVLDFLLDPYTNETVTREVSSNGNQVIFKEIDGQTMKLADLASTGEKFLVTTKDGRRYQATKVKLTYFGFLLISDNELHSYDGERHEQLFFPEGFSAAPVQRHDIYETGAMLLERQQGSSGEFAEFKSLGRFFGMNNKLDYALLNFRNGQVEFFDVDLAGKNVSTMYNCVPKKGGLFNECQDIRKDEALYDSDGFINNDHYLWAVDWARTSSGLFAIVQENNKISITNMETGERKLAFHRGLGINWFEVEETGEGILTLTAKLGFKKKTIDDVVSTFAQLPAFDEEE